VSPPNVELRRFRRIMALSVVWKVAALVAVAAVLGWLYGGG
jgi:hypothetical protein